MTNHLKSILKDHRVTQAVFARELVVAGIYKNFPSAKTSVYNHCRNSYQSFDWKMLQFTMRRFHLKVEDIITFDE
jgi:hypothetical protein